MIAALALLGSGCAIPYGELVLAAPGSSSIPSVRVLARDVTGEHCHRPLFGFGGANYAAAVEDAVSSVPGGTLMADVAVYLEVTQRFRYIRPAIVCARVVGDVGAFE